MQYPQLAVVLRRVRWTAFGARGNLLRHLILAVAVV